MAAVQVDLAKKAAVAVAAAAAKSVAKTVDNTTSKIKKIGAQLVQISRQDKDRLSKYAASKRLLTKIQELSKRHPLPAYYPELLVMQQQQKTSSENSNKQSSEVQPPTTPQIKLEARICVLFDASYLRRFLIEEREREAVDAKFDLADVVWVKVKGEPWWPAMVSVHPQRDCYLKYRSRNTLAYHIQTFGVIYHGWVSEREIARFQGWEQFEADMLERIAACRQTPDLERIWRSFTLGHRSEKKALFSLAVAEATAAGRLTTAQRLSTLTYRYYSKRYSKFFEA